MDQASIQHILSEAVGNPDVGILHDAIPGMAAALAAALNPPAPGNTGAEAKSSAKEQRITKADETR
jgi:hypothetical protein